MVITWAEGHEQGLLTFVTVTGIHINLFSTPGTTALKSDRNLGLSKSMLSIHPVSRTRNSRVEVGVLEIA